MMGAEVGKLGVLYRPEVQNGSGAVLDALLLEDGTALLLEDGTELLLG